MDKKILEVTKNYQSKVIEKLDKKAVVSTGSLILNDLTGIGGYPQNRIVEIFGQLSTGKTTLTIYAIKAIQNKIKTKQIVFLDVERTLNPDYAAKCGVDLKRLLIIQPKNAEETFNLVIDFLKTNLIALIIIDSVAALLPQREKSDKMEDNTIGLQARLMSKAMRKINYLLTEHNANIIFVNQIREKINKFFGNPETTAGGNALKFYATLRIQLKRKGKLVINQKEVGFITKVRIIKNKVAMPFTEGEIEFFYDRGISQERELIQLATAKKIINKNGDWFWYNQIKLGLGIEQAITFCKNNPKIQREILERLQ